MLNNNDVDLTIEQLNNKGGSIQQTLNEINGFIKNIQGSEHQLFDKPQWEEQNRKQQIKKQQKDLEDYAFKNQIKRHEPLQKQQQRLSQISLNLDDLQYKHVNLSYFQNKRYNGASSEYKNKSETIFSDLRGSLQNFDHPLRNSRSQEKLLQIQLKFNKLIQKGELQIPINQTTLCSIDNEQIQEIKQTDNQRSQKSKINQNINGSSNITKQNGSFINAMDALQRKIKGQEEQIFKQQEYFQSEIQDQIEQNHSKNIIIERLQKDLEETNQKLMEANNQIHIQKEFFFKKNQVLEFQSNLLLSQIQDQQQCFQKQLDTLLQKNQTYVSQIEKQIVFQEKLQLKLEQTEKDLSVSQQREQKILERERIQIEKNEKLQQQIEELNNRLNEQKSNFDKKLIEYEQKQFDLTKQISDQKKYRVLNQKAALSHIIKGLDQTCNMNEFNFQLALFNECDSSQIQKLEQRLIEINSEYQFWIDKSKNGDRKEKQECRQKALQLLQEMQNTSDQLRVFKKQLY